MYEHLKDMFEHPSSIYKHHKVNYVLFIYSFVKLNEQTKVKVVLINYVEIMLLHYYKDIYYEPTNIKVIKTRCRFN